MFVTMDVDERKKMWARSNNVHVTIIAQENLNTTCVPRLSRNFMFFFFSLSICDLPVLTPISLARLFSGLCACCLVHLLHTLVPQGFLQACKHSVLILTIIIIIIIIVPTGFWPKGQNPRHPRSPRVYTFKDKEYLLTK